jgi:hypothetical protein
MSINTALFKIILKENKPNLSVGSVNTYLSVFRTIALNIKKDLNDIEDFIKYQPEILEYMNSISPTMKKSRIAGVISLLKKNDDSMDDKTKESIKTYNTEMLRAVSEYNKTANDQVLTDRQKENFMSWDEIMEVYNKMASIANQLWKIPKEQITHDIFEILQHFVLLSVYVLMPPRRSLDYAGMKIRNENSNLNSVDNYIIQKRNKWQFVFNSYKNSTRLGKQIVDIPSTLKDILKKWMYVNKGDYLIFAKNNKQVQSTKINSMLANIFKKPIGPSLLRHAYMTKFFGNVDLKKLEEATQSMGSSDIKTMLQYVNKNDKEKEEI